MINECLTLLRRRREASGEEIAAAEDFPETSAPQGAARLNLKDMKAVLENAIAALPRNLRAVFVLRDVQQLSTEEAAACLRVTPGSIKVTLHRARERLKASLLESAAGAELFEYRAEFCDPFTTRVMSAILGDR